MSSKWDRYAAKERERMNYRRHKGFRFPAHQYRYDQLLEYAMSSMIDKYTEGARGKNGTQTKITKARFKRMEKVARLLRMARPPRKE